MVDEAFAGPLVVDQFLVEVGLLEAHGVVDAGHRALIVMVAGGVADDFVIRLRTPVERAEQIDFGPADVEFVQMAAAAGGQKRDDAVAGQADFLAGVEIEVVGVDLHPPRGPPAGRLEQRIGGNQMVVNGVPQMRQIKTAEGPVPVRAVALSAVKLGPRLRRRGAAARRPLLPR